MKIVVISDTHGMHLQMHHKLPPADMIIHAGDFGNHGNMIDCVRFFNWFNALPYKYKVCIAGNHDIFMDTNFVNGGGTFSAIKAIIPPDVIYLNNESVVIEGLKFYGSPESPAFFNWAFNVERGPDLAKHWAKIPEDTDILITHGPVKGFQDECPDFNCLGRYVSVGDQDLLEVVNKIKPKVHICGHVHFGYGSKFGPDTLFVNASTCTEHYTPSNKPIMIDFIEDEPIIVAHYDKITGQS